MALGHGEVEHQQHHPAGGWGLSMGCEGGHRKKAEMGKASLRIPISIQLGARGVAGLSIPSAGGATQT